jgi:hypothetical protein
MDADTFLQKKALNPDIEKTKLVKYLCVTLDTADVYRVRQIIFRLTREKVFAFVYPLEDPAFSTQKVSKELQSRHILFLIYPSNIVEQHRKIDGMLGAFSARKQILPTLAGGYKDSLHQLSVSLQELKNVHRSDPRL